MADEKKLEKAEAPAGTTFLNRGKRHFDIGFHPDGKAKRHSPGTTMAYTAEEAKRHEGYADLIDISKIPGSIDTKRLASDNAKLLAENLALKEQLEALGETKAADKEPKPEKSSKKEKAAVA